MSLAALVATVMLTLLLGFIALVVYATMHQVRDEAEAAAQQRDRY